MIELLQKQVDFLHHKIILLKCIEAVEHGVGGLLIIRHRKEEFIFNVKDFRDPLIKMLKTTSAIVTTTKPQPGDQGG